jgi:putative FmdB family regulatory protein
MPIYDYVCSQCGRRTEVMHGIHAAGPATCETCGGALKKALSPPAIGFRGTGWAKKERSTAAGAASAKPDGDSSSTADAGKETTAKSPSGSEGSTSTQGTTSTKADPASSSTISSSSATPGT